MGKDKKGKKRVATKYTAKAVPQYWPGGLWLPLGLKNGLQPATRLGVLYRMPHKRRLRIPRISRKIWPTLSRSSHQEQLMQRPIIFIVLLFVVTRPAFAVNWVETVKGINRSTSYIDTDSIRRDGHKVTVWSRHMLDEPLPLPGASGSFTEMRIRQTIDCQARTSAHSIVRLYDKGKEVMSETADPPSAKPIISGGIADKTRQSVCKPAKSGPH